VEGLGGGEGREPNKNLLSFMLESILISPRRTMRKHQGNARSGPELSTRGPRLIRAEQSRLAAEPIVARAHARTLNVQPQQLVQLAKRILPATVPFII